MIRARIAYDEFAALSWASFVSWAFAEPKMRDAFVADGGSFAAPTSPIDRLIDAATGRVAAEIEAFVLWATRKHFGMRYAPKAYRDAVAGKRKPRACRHRNWNVEADGGARCLGTGCTKTMTKAEVDAATEAA